MVSSIRQSYLAIICAFTLLFQLFAPSLAMASGNGPSLLCNPTGQVSAEMQAALDALKADLGIEETEEAPAQCEQCVASVYAIPTKSAGLNLSVDWAHEFESPR